MALRPKDWNVVVLGRWNPALFTPAAISRRIFGLEEGIPVEVFVVLDDVQQPRVKYEDLIVAPSFGQLLISPAICNFDLLDKARMKARKTIEDLPKTPMTAAGYNLRFESDEMPVSLIERFSDDLDKRFSDNNFQIIGRQFHRVLKFDPGQLLVRVTGDPNGKAEVLLNFDLQSKDREALISWLELPIDRIRDAVQCILGLTLELKEEDYVFESN